MSWRLRRMTASDIDAALALDRQTPEAPHWGREAYLDCINAQNETSRKVAWIAETGERLLGFCIGRLVAGICELESIAVAPEMRGQGIGRALLDALTEWAEEHGARKMELEVRASNHAAIRLYEQAGWKHEGVRRGYYPSPEEDALLMGRDLARWKTS